MAVIAEDQGISVAMGLLMLSQHNRRFIKKLTTSDINGQDRLMLNAKFVEQYVLPLITPAKAELCNSPQGAEFRVWDPNDDTYYNLRLRKYRDNSPYVLIGQWRRKFVHRKRLEKGDTVAISFVHNTFIIDLLAKNLQA